MRRFITILIILFIILAIVLSVGWFFARRTAQKNGTTSPSFKEFISLSTKKGEGQLPDGGLSSDFTDEEISTPGQQNPGVTPDGGLTAIPMQSSQFTSSPITPGGAAGSLDGLNLGDNSLGGNLTPGAVFGSGSTTTTPGATTTPGQSTGSTPGQSTATAPLCSDNDTNIAFTPEELDKLNRLQNRFYAIAQTLHTDNDVAAELANYDVFKAKSDRALELYNYCATKAPLIADQNYQQRVPTPFWRDIQQDKEGFITNSPFTNLVNPSSSGAVRSNIEHIFRLNLW